MFNITEIVCLLICTSVTRLILCICALHSGIEIERVWTDMHVIVLTLRIIVEVVEMKMLGKFVIFIAFVILYCFASNGA